MKIETKFNIGEDAYYYSDELQEFLKSEVTDIKIEILTTENITTCFHEKSCVEKNIYVTYWVKIGKKNIISGTVPLAQAIFLLV